MALSDTLVAAGIPCQSSRTDQLQGKTPKAIAISVGNQVRSGSFVLARIVPAVSESCCWHLRHCCASLPYSLAA